MRNVISQSDNFEPELIALIAPLRLELVLSQYSVGKCWKEDETSQTIPPCIAQSNLTLLYGLPRVRNANLNDR